MICPDCKGAKMLAVGEAHPGGGTVAWIGCARCGSSGAINPERDRWRDTGAMHRTRRIGRRESIRDCAARLGIAVAELCDMENGRTDPERLAAETPPKTRLRSAP
jgi:hypothetical protein